MKKNLLIAALFASVCGWAWADNNAPKQVAAVDVPTIVPTTPGDANGDGEINLADASLVVDFYLGKDVTDFKEKNADVNGDGEINLADASLIVDFYLGKVTSL